MNSVSMTLNINKFICRRPDVCPIFDFFLSNYSDTLVSIVWLILGTVETLFCLMLMPVLNI
jgi:hypothetical protein